MGERGAARVKDMFGRDQMAKRLDTIVDEIVALERQPPVINAVINFAGTALVFVIGLVCARMFTKADRSTPLLHAARRKLVRERLKPSIQEALRPSSRRSTYVQIWNDCAVPGSVVKFHIE
ncbi:hypothetical protein G7046_g5692 [Stylonectria norvegica]|nr:hypothetical protein G7046_g5692 [Stylonectria norvegica]